MQYLYLSLYKKSWCTETDFSCFLFRAYCLYLCEITSYIDEHCTEDLTLESVADRAGFSKYHFSRLFKQFSGQTFYQYVSKKRIEQAELLLAREDMSITDVASASGFESLSAFIRMFKLIKGMTPTQYRKMRYA